MIRTRREMLELMGVGALWFVTPGCVTQTGGFFTDSERQALGALADSILPPDDQPGGAALGAVAFIERYLTALDGPGTPQIYAGGPFSGRQPYTLNGTDSPPNDFEHFLPLDRVTLAGWKMSLFGSDGIAGGAPNDSLLGNRIGLRAQVKDGLQKVLQRSPGPLETWLGGAQAPLLESFDLDPAFRDLLVILVSQAAFSAPEYGGNTALNGWKMVHFEGDSMPRGYSEYDPVTQTFLERADAPLTTADAVNVEPLDEEIRGVLSLIMLGLGGKVFP